MTGREWARATAVMAAAAGIVLVVALLVVPAASATRVSNSRPSSEVRVCAANVQNTPDMPDRDVRDDVRKAGRSCDLILWQEIGEEADHRAVREVLGDGWRTSSTKTRPSPVSWRTSRFRLVGDIEEIRVSDPTPRCPSGRVSYNPARFITLVPLRARATGQELTAISLHFPQRRTCRTADTRAKWRQAYDTARANLPAGAVVLGGDWNRREAEIPAMTRWHWTTPAPRGLDHIAVARTGWSTRHKFTRELNSDHDLAGVRMSLT